MDSSVGVASRQKRRHSTDRHSSRPAFATTTRPYPRIARPKLRSSRVTQVKNIIHTTPCLAVQAQSLLHPRPVLLPAILHAACDYIYSITDLYHVSNRSGCHMSAVCPPRTVYQEGGGGGRKMKISPEEPPSHGNPQPISYFLFVLFVFSQRYYILYY